MSNIRTEVSSSLDMWAAFLIQHDLFNKDHLPLPLDSASLKKTLNVINIMNFDYERRQAYEDHLKWLRIETNILKKYEAKKFDTGKIKELLCQKK